MSFLSPKQTSDIAAALDLTTFEVKDNYDVKPPAAALSPLTGAKATLVEVDSLFPSLNNHRQRDSEWLSSIAELSQAMIESGFNPATPIIVNGHEILCGTRRVAAWVVARARVPGMPSKIPAFDVAPAKPSAEQLIKVTYDRGRIKEGMPFRDGEFLLFAKDMWDSGYQRPSQLGKALAESPQGDKVDKFAYPLCLAAELLPEDGGKIFQLALQGRSDGADKNEYAVRTPQTALLRRAIAADNKNDDPNYTITKEAIRALTTEKGAAHLAAFMSDNKGRISGYVANEAAIDAFQLPEKSAKKKGKDDEVVPQTAMRDGIRQVCGSQWLQVLVVPDPTRYSVPVWKELKAMMLDMNELIELKRKGITPDPKRLTKLADKLFFGHVGVVDGGESPPFDAEPVDKPTAEGKHQRSTRGKPAPKGKPRK